MSKRKPKTVAKLLDEAAVLTQLKVRLKAADDHGMAQCATCNTRKHYKEMDGGHYIGRRWTATKILEENIHCQCKACNGFQGGALDRYTLFMIDFYGREFVDELQILKHQTKKYGRQEILDIIAELKHDIKELESKFT